MAGKGVGERLRGLGLNDLRQQELVSSPAGVSSAQTVAPDVNQAITIDNPPPTPEPVPVSKKGIASNPNAARVLSQVASIGAQIANKSAQFRPESHTDENLALGSELTALRQQRTGLLSSIGLTEASYDQAITNYLAATVGGRPGTQPAPYATNLTPEQIDKYANMTQEQLLEANPELGKGTPAGEGGTKFMSGQSAANKAAEAATEASSTAAVNQALSEAKVKADDMVKSGDAVGAKQHLDTTVSELAEVYGADRVNAGIAKAFPTLVGTKATTPTEPTVRVVSIGTVTPDEIQAGVYPKGIQVGDKIATMVTGEQVKVGDASKSLNDLLTVSQLRVANVRPADLNIAKAEEAWLAGATVVGISKEPGKLTVKGADGAVKDIPVSPEDIVTRQAFEASNILLPDGTWVPIRSGINDNGTEFVGWNDIPEQYQRIALTKTFKDMVDTIEKDNAEAKQAQEAQMQAINTAKPVSQAVSEEMVAARAEKLPETPQTWLYRDPAGVSRNATEAERKAILDERGWNSSYFDRFTRNLPQVADTVQEALSFGGATTQAYNRDQLEKEYQTQKEIALATLTGDTEKLDELYKSGAFGADETVPTWDYRDPSRGGAIRAISADERTAIIQLKPNAADLITVGRGTPTPPKAYKDALTAVQQQDDIRTAVANGDTTALAQLFKEGAFGSDISNYNSLVKYVNEGGRELSPVSAKDVSDFSASFGTATDYADKALAAQPSSGEMLKDISISLVPVYGTVYFWDKMNPGMRAMSMATDVLTLIPVAGGISAAARAATGIGRSARIAAGMRAIPQIALSEIKAPFTALAHPIATAKATVGETRNIIETLVDLRKVPHSTLSPAFGTIRLDAAVAGSPEAAMHIRDTLMKMAEAGQKPIVTWGGKTYTLRSGSFMGEGGVAAAGPDMRWVETAGGATVQTKVYPEGHPLAGQRVQEREQGFFVANTALERFTMSSAFGLENVGAKADKLKAIQEAVDAATVAGDAQKAAKLQKLADQYNKAVEAGSVSKLNKAEAKITKKLSDLAVDETISNINSYLTDANQKYVLNDIAGSQESMAKAQELIDSLRAGKPGYAVFSPSTQWVLDPQGFGSPRPGTVPSAKVYPGVIFKAGPADFFQIAAHDIAADQAAQMLLHAGQLRKVGRLEEAAKLTSDAQELIKTGKSGFTKVTTAEMELKYPELYRLPEMKARYYTRSGNKKLYIFTDEPFSAMKAIKSKIRGPIDTVRNMFDPAISAKAIPLTDVERVARATELERFADRAGSTDAARLARLEAGELRKGMSGAKTAEDAIRSSLKIDEVDDYLQAARTAADAGDEAAAARLTAEAGKIGRARESARAFVRESSRRAGTVAGVSVYSRALLQLRENGAQPIPPRTPDERAPERGATERLSPESVRDLARLTTPERETARIAAERRGDVTRETVPAEIRGAGRGPERSSEMRGIRTPEGPRDTPRIPESPRIPETPRIPESPRTPRTPETPRIPERGRIPPPGRRVPPGERIYIPRRDRIPDPNIRIRINTDASGNQLADLPIGAATWRQGWGWWFIPPELIGKTGVKPYTLPRNVSPRGAQTTGRTPPETIQLIGGGSTPTISLNMGKVNVFIAENAEKIAFEGGGESDNVGSMGSNTVGMASPAKGHAYAANYYPQHSVSRTAISTGHVNRQTRGVNRPEALAGLQPSEEPQLETLSLSSLSLLTVAKTAKAPMRKVANRANLSGKKPKRVRRASIATAMMGVRL